MVLEYFARKWPTPGLHFDSSKAAEDFPLFDAIAAGEVTYCIETLFEQGALQRFTGYDARITAEGWKRLSPSDPGGERGTCFVAMAFDSSLDSAYAAIEAAIRGCGLAGGRVDRIQHNHKIDDVILAGIRRSQVVIADVTLQRTGVYFEAGFALGLGRIVVWCCREDDKANIHFDTRQYNHIFWAFAHELTEKLEARLRGTVQIPGTALGEAALDRPA